MSDWTAIGTASTRDVTIDSAEIPAPESMAYLSNEWKLNVMVYSFLITNLGDYFNKIFPIFSFHEWRWHSHTSPTIIAYSCTWNRQVTARGEHLIASQLVLAARHRQTRLASQRFGTHKATKRAIASKTCPSARRPFKFIVRAFTFSLGI